MNDAPRPPLLQRLLDAPHAHGFFAALRLVEAAFPAAPRLGRGVRPAQDAVRIVQEPDVAFAPAIFAAAEPGPPIRLSTHAFGLFGPDGPLPLHLTEYARDRRRHARDATFQRFADIFHHRAACLFYRAWADVRPTVSFDRPQTDRFALYVGALIGIGHEALRGRDRMPDLTRLFVSGHLSAQTRHADGLAAILSQFFDVPVRVLCFVGAWMGLPTGDLSRLGQRHATLSNGALLGARVWTRQQKFRLAFGPLSLADYERLLPGGASLAKLVPVVRTYADDTMLWDVNLVLRASEVPRTVLGRRGKLGWTTWLLPRRSSADAADLLLDASADGFVRKHYPEKAA